MVLSLVKKDRAVGINDYDGRSALHIAAAEGHTRTVKILLQYSSVVNRMMQENRWNSTPLSAALKGKHYDVVQLLKKSGYPVRCAEETVDRGQLAAI